MSRAALYLRSSKDRSDVSIDAQRRQLGELAIQRKLEICAEFTDVVESGKDDQRPGFQSLIAAVRDKKREWDTILILDTSRLARRRHIAILFEENECRRHGVHIVYKSLPDADPMTEMLLKSIMQAMDEWHSLSSRQKGLAGMAENVRQGWRAGGRAPLGYELQHVSTGTIRDGSPVMKSRLILSPESEKVRVYLQSKAAGMSRKLAMDVAGLRVAASTAIGIEWNAMTYAGHTVWNQRNEITTGGYAGCVKRKPRHEWLISRETHTALISDEEAEALLSSLERKSKSASRRSKSEYLLSGVLSDQDGKPWHGDGEGYYRVGKGRRISAGRVEAAVLEQLFEDLQATEFVKALTDALRGQAEKRKKDVALPKLKKELSEIETRISRITELLGQTKTPGPLLRQIEEYETRRLTLLDEIENRAALESDADKIRSVSESQVREMLLGFAEDLQSFDRDHLKNFICSLLEKIELDAINYTFQLTYRLSAGDKVASPRGFEPRLPP